MARLDGVCEEISRLFRDRGDSEYGGEAVTQRQHALQTADRAERDGADVPLITAALLHDIGHLLHDLPDDAPAADIDDRHERLAARWLADRFGPEVVEPVRLHVAAKRYLCTVEPGYHDLLSEPSRTSLALQGGPMTADEVRDFEASPHWRDAVRLRRWDDAAKAPGLPTPDVAHFLRRLRDATPGADP